MNDDHGSREITDEDRKAAILHELIHRKSNVRITEGMRRGLERTRPPLWWWAVMVLGLAVTIPLAVRLMTVML